MQNPLTSNFLRLVLYFLLWTIISVVHILFLQKSYSLDWSLVIIDGLAFNFSFAVLSLGLWYVVKYSLWDENDIAQIILNLFAASLLIVLFWISFNELLLRWIFYSDNAYKDILKLSRFWRVFQGLFYYILSILIYYVIMYYMKLQEKTNKEVELKRSITEARLNLIRNQVNPHFLFNSLNSISSLTLSEGDKARKMISGLSDFLRFSLSHNPSDLISLKEELSICQKYLEIEKIRFDEKMDYKVNVEKNCLNYMVPNLILQPIIENAIKHGVQQNLEKTVINCDIKSKDNHLEICIENDIESKMNPDIIGTGFGQKHIKERLSLIYKGKAKVVFASRGMRYQSKISIPLSS